MTTNPAERLRDAESRLDEHRLIAHEKCSDNNPCSRRKWLQRQLSAALAASGTHSIPPQDGQRFELAQHAIEVLSARLEEARWWRNRTHDGAICAPGDCVECDRIFELRNAVSKNLETPLSEALAHAKALSRWLSTALTCMNINVYDGAMKALKNYHQWTDAVAKMPPASQGLPRAASGTEAAPDTQVKMRLVCRYCGHEAQEGEWVGVHGCSKCNPSTIWGTAQPMNIPPGVPAQAAASPEGEGREALCFAIAALEPERLKSTEYKTGFIDAKNFALKLVERQSAAPSGGAALRETLERGLALVESTVAHVSHGGPTRADAEKWIQEARNALKS